MFVVTINNKVFIAENIADNSLYNAMAVNSPDKIGKRDIIAYFKAKNLNELKDVSFGNAVYTSRAFTVSEQGMVGLVASAMDEAKKSALAGVENARMEELLGEN